MQKKENEQISNNILYQIHSMSSLEKTIQCNSWDLYAPSSYLAQFQNFELVKEVNRVTLRSLKKGLIMVLVMYEQSADHWNFKIFIGNGTYSNSLLVT